jgi:hypothetical protein
MNFNKRKKNETVLSLKIEKAVYHNDQVQEIFFFKVSSYFI